MTKEIVKRMEVDIGWHSNPVYICFCHKGHFPLKCLNLYVLLVVDFHEFPNEIGEEKHVNIPLRNSLLSKSTFGPKQTSTAPWWPSENRVLQSSWFCSYRSHPRIETSFQACL